MKPFFFLSLLALSISSIAQASDDRIVTLGGPITEIVFALGAGDRVVAVDQSSMVPSEVSSLPDVGYVGALSAEGVLSLQPTLILASSRLGPPAVGEQLAASGVPMDVIQNPNSAETLRDAIFELGSTLGQGEEAADLWSSVEAGLAQATAMVEASGQSPQVVLLMGAGNQVMAAGRGTAAHGIIELSGGSNLFDGHTSYRAVSEEALIGSSPDVILVASMSGEEGDARDRLREMGLSALAASTEARVAFVETGYYLSFGPRTGQAAQDLAEILVGEGD